MLSKHHKPKYDAFARSTNPYPDQQTQTLVGLSVMAMNGQPCSHDSLNQPKLAGVR